MSMYECSASSGVPYTTINKLVNQKMDINKISAEALKRLSVTLQIDIDALLNEFIFWDGLRSHYGKYSYKWYVNKDKKLTIELLVSKGKKVDIPTEYTYIPRQNWRFYREVAEFRIQDYLDEMEFQKKVEVNT